MSIHPAMRPVRRMVQCEGIVSLAMPCLSIFEPFISTKLFNSLNTSGSFNCTFASAAIYALTVPEKYGKKNKVEVRNKILLVSFGTFIRLLLSIYLYIPRQKQHRSISFSCCKIKSVFYISQFVASK